MFGKRAALSHPAAEQFAFAGGKLLLVISGRHGVVGRMDSHQQFALVGRVGVDRSIAAQIARGRREGIESQHVFVPAVRTVTDKTLVRKHWENLAGKIDWSPLPDCAILLGV